MDAVRKRLSPLGRLFRRGEPPSPEEEITGSENAQPSRRHLVQRSNRRSQKTLARKRAARNPKKISYGGSQPGSEAPFHAGKQNKKR